MDNKNNRRKKITPAFVTYALADKVKTSPESKTTQPSEEAVIEAKNWVDHVAL